MAKTEAKHKKNKKIEKSVKMSALYTATIYLQTGMPSMDQFNGR